MVNAERVVQIEDGIEWKELKKGHNKGGWFCVSAILSPKCYHVE